MSYGYEARIVKGLSVSVKNKNTTDVTVNRNGHRNPLAKDEQ